MAGCCLRYSLVVAALGALLNYITSQGNENVNYKEKAGAGSILTLVLLS